MGYLKFSLFYANSFVYFQSVSLLRRTSILISVSDTQEPRAGGTSRYFYIDVIMRSTKSVCFKMQNEL